MWTVYILQCADGTMYVGCTGNMEERMRRHREGHVSYTHDRQPLVILHRSVFNDKYKAFAFEHYLKSGSGRAFMRKRLV
jgi:predicted GIY-YIG superfamily endonuclease